MAQITPEVQKQLDEQKKNCIFCRIVSGEVQGERVYEDSVMIGILDINPGCKGHTLLLPKEHYPILPFLPEDKFKHMFGILPRIVGAIKKSLLYTGVAVFIANGGIAGQQAPHFLAHLLGREKRDGIFCFDFSGKSNVDSAKNVQLAQMLKEHAPKLFGSKTQKAENISKLNEDIKKGADVIFEDQECLIILSKNAQCVGHLEVYSQKEANDIEKLKADDCAILFWVVSTIASVLFDAIGAQGTNIILKTGISDDNLSGRLVVHVLSRFENDGLSVLWNPKEDKGNLSEVSSKIRDQTFIIEQSLKKKDQPKVIDLSSSHVVYEIKDQDEDLGVFGEITEALKKTKSRKEDN